MLKHISRAAPQPLNAEALLFEDSIFCSEDFHKESVLETSSVQVHPPSKIACLVLLS